jgi:hypothetical protein
VAITTLLLSFVLLAVCVVVHAIGSVATLGRLERSPVLADGAFWPTTWLLVRIAGWLVLMHLLDIALWGLLYAWGRAFPDLRSALYFSSVTYTTVGYGDLVLPSSWRHVGGIEALTGILMCGWSTGLFFSVVTRIHVTAPDVATRSNEPPASSSSSGFRARGPSV